MHDKKVKTSAPITYINPSSYILNVNPDAYISRATQKPGDIPSPGQKYYTKLQLGQFLFPLPTPVSGIKGGVDTAGAGSK